MLGVCTYVYVHMYMYIYIFFAFRSLRYRTLHNTVHTVLCQTIAFRKTKILHTIQMYLTDIQYKVHLTLRETQVHLIHNPKCTFPYLQYKCAVDYKGAT